MFAEVVDDPRFELRGRLGSGGMGTVHRAFDRLLGREVALKVGRPPGIPGRLIGGGADAARIGDEFALLATLDHPGLVRVLDFGVGAAGAWLTSELVEGPRLDLWAGRARPDGPAWIALVRDLLETLGWLHARGLVHGDVKPANVLVAASGPVLIDFGLAGSGDVLFGATRAYAAPELLAGDPPSAASDLFALGRTLERVELVRHVPALTSLVRALVAARPAERPSHDEAIDALDRITGAHSTPTRARSRAELEVRPARPWAGAVERALEALAATPVLGVRVPERHRATFLGALAARLMLGGRRAFGLPEGQGLAAFARVGAALGLALEPPTGVRAEDVREVLDAFADRLVTALKTVAEPARPVLVVSDRARLGAAERFVLARLIEARALPGFVIAGLGPPLERGAEAAMRTLDVLDSEAGGRRWESEWDALSDDARRVARELAALGGAARVEELAAPAARSALTELVEAGVTERSAAGRTALRPEVLEAIGVVIAVAAPSEDERRRWIEVLERADAPSAARLRALARHASALDDHDRAARAWVRAAALAEGELAWPMVAHDHLEAARTFEALGEHARAFDAARAALAASRVSGGGPIVEQALALLARDANTDELARQETIERSRVALDRGDLGDAERLTSAVLEGNGSALERRQRFEVLLVRGTARSQGQDKAGAERDLEEAAALAQAMGDLHALGRTTNNLGMLAFHRGDLERAAHAWERAAAAKAEAGDRRGERIGRHNRGLALRELGRLDEAEVATREAGALAEAIGDTVGRATAALARAQLALDRADLERADAALESFAAVEHKPPLVAADGLIVKARRELVGGRAEAAVAAAQAALEQAVSHALQPVAAEAWALLTIATRRAIEPPELVRGSLERAMDERGGLALLLLFVRAWHEAQAGRWGEARRLLGAAQARRAGMLWPPAARIGIELAREAARLVEPALAEAFEARAEGIAQGQRGTEEAGRGLARMPLRLEEWATHLRRELRAERVEVVPLEGEPVVDAETGPDGARFLELGRRVARSGERFVARADDERPEVIAWPLVLGGAAVGALVARFAGTAHEQAARTLTRDDDASGVFQGVALVLGHAHERRRRERAETEVARLEGELRARLEAHEAEVTALRDALEQSQSALALRYDYGHIVHRSAAMRRVLETLDKVTDRDLPVLVLGESGVGKELLARALHFNGPRQKKRFVAENCGAVPKDLFESTFFGHVKGAFTGAMSQRQGLFEAADGGTLFLDEIGELPLEMQVKLLRVLQERKVRPVGSSREIPVDFRLVCATNRDLAQMVAQGRFREDLFYRIAVVKVEVPPLRERPEDIVPIAEHLLAHHGERLGRAVRLSPEAADRLAAHAFAGNVRELENEILRALALSDGPEIRPRHLSPAVQGRSEPRRRSANPGDEGALETLEAAFARVERELILRHLRASRGQKVGAAKSLGLSRPGLDAKLARHGIDVKELARSLKEPPR